MAQEASVLDQIFEEINNLQSEATTDGIFHFELVNQIRLQCVLRDLKKERDRSPSARVFDQLGRVYCLRQDEAKSREYHLKSIKLEPHSAIRCTNYAVTLSKFGHLNESVEFYKKGLNIDPAYMRGWKYLLNDLILLENYKEALVVIDEIIMRNKTKENQQMKEYLLELYYPPEEEISDELINAVRESEEDIKAGRFTKCKTREESISFLDSLVSE